MIRKTFLFICTLLSMLPIGGAFAADFTPIAGWDKQIFPSFVIATGAMKGDDSKAREDLLGDRFGLLGVEITATHDNQPIKVTIEADNFLSTSEFEGRLPKKGQSYRVLPKIKYRFDKLGECKQATNVAVSFKVALGKEAPTSTTENITIRSINDCPFSIHVGEERIDTSFVFAAYVNEQHPFVDKMLREALDIGLVNRFIGYQGDRADVINQVYAIWDLLVARDVRYSSITTTAAESSQTGSQHVRLVEETINNTQANCVDGSVLMVSILRKIGIDSFLVLVPGHCYVAFYADREGTELIGIETTLMDTRAEEQEDELELVSDDIDESIRREESWGSFVAAVNHATSKLEEDADKFADETQHDYLLLNVSSFRKIGVLPIPFTGKEDFLAFDHSVSATADSESDDSDEMTEDDASE